ncbi:hypothetical protein [Citreimonas salinaria]|uniref:Uncharacterized protein n=1 Tax=Citreimonas salinaria TaxID=321339 RepID=A0A1H3MQT0_9RHOB|nr:hypothetical protein [Citreimonas salinaria]SDY78853.1 hypothetical protein SAMN05444340_11819 [Citreimonas salinaria]
MTVFGWWLTIVGGLILSGIVVPYGILSGAPASSGIAVFWTLFALGVVAVIAAGIRGWRA